MWLWLCCSRNLSVIVVIVSVPYQCVGKLWKVKRACLSLYICHFVPLTYFVLTSGSGVWTIFSKYLKSVSFEYIEPSLYGFNAYNKLLCQSISTKHFNFKLHCTMYNVMGIRFCDLVSLWNVLICLFKYYIQ